MIPGMGDHGEEVIFGADEIGQRVLAIYSDLNQIKWEYDLPDRTFDATLRGVLELATMLLQEVCTHPEIEASVCPVCHAHVPDLGEVFTCKAVGCIRIEDHDGRHMNADGIEWAPEPADPVHVHFEAVVSPPRTICNESKSLGGKVYLCDSDRGHLSPHNFKERR